MKTSRALALHLFGPTLFVLAACSSSPSQPSTLAPDVPPDPAKPEPPRPDGRGEIVVGLQSEDIRAAFGFDVERVEIVARIEGAPSVTDAFKPSDKPLPHETRFTAPEKSPNARLDVEVRGFAPENIVGAPRDGEGPKPIVRRLATTRFAPQKTRLLRLRFEQRCVTSPGMMGGGAFYGPECTAPETCISGKCRSSEVPVEALEPYTKAWPSNAPDECKSTGGGRPEVIVGTGETAFGAIAQDQTLTPVCGPQGGSHIWVAVRMRNLKQVDSVTTITATQPGTGLELPASAFVYTYDKDGDACALNGLRLQFASGGTAFRDFLGKPLDIKVEVAEPNGGAKGSGVAHIKVASAIDDPWHRCGP